jgi:hypothetical protein
MMDGLFFLVLGLVMLAVSSVGVAGAAELVRDPPESLDEKVLLWGIVLAFAIQIGLDVALMVAAMSSL